MTHVTDNGYSLGPQLLMLLCRFHKYSDLVRPIGGIVPVRRSAHNSAFGVRKVKQAVTQLVIQDKAAGVIRHVGPDVGRSSERCFATGPAVTFRRLLMQHCQTGKVTGNTMLHTVGLKLCDIGRKLGVYVGAATGKHYRYQDASHSWDYTLLGSKGQGERAIP